MTIVEETHALRCQLHEWANDPEWSLLVHYELLPQQPPPVWYQRVSQRIGRLLRVMGLSRSHYLKQRWHAGLKHAAGASGAKPLLLWAVDTNPICLREACVGVQCLLAGRTDLAPILVTDVADFAFYSRLKWLVEYLPDLNGEGRSYRERKKRYLAWRYREAIILPLSVGLASKVDWDQLLDLPLNVSE